MKYDVELSYGIGFTVSGIEADNQSEAIEKAKQIAEQTMLTTPVTGNDVEIDAGCLEYDQCSYIQEH